MRLRDEIREELGTAQGTVDGSGIVRGIGIQRSPRDDDVEHAVDPVDGIPIELNRVDEPANESPLAVAEHDSNVHRAATGTLFELAGTEDDFEQVSTLFQRL
jgi:hypothetical protein